MDVVVMLDAALAEVVVHRRWVAALADAAYVAGPMGLGVLHQVGVVAVPVAAAVVVVVVEFVAVVVVVAVEIVVAVAVAGVPWAC